MGALRSARSGGGKTNQATKQAIERGQAPHQFSGGHAADELAHTTTATVSQPSARQLFSSRHGAAESLGGAQHMRADLTKKHVYVAGEAHVHGLYDKPVENTKIQSRALAHVCELRTRSDPLELASEVGTREPPMTLRFVQARVLGGARAHRE